MTFIWGQFHEITQPSITKMSSKTPRGQWINTVIFICSVFHQPTASCRQMTDLSWDFPYIVIVIILVPLSQGCPDMLGIPVGLVPSADHKVGVAHCWASCRYCPGTEQQMRTSSDGVIAVNSLAPGRFELNFIWVIFQLILTIDGWGNSEIVLRWLHWT